MVLFFALLLSVNVVSCLSFRRLDGGRARVASVSLGRLHSLICSVERDLSDQISGASATRFDWAATSKEVDNRCVDERDLLCGPPLWLGPADHRALGIIARVRLVT